jgi:GDPmannose 4,6-dehydratase
MEAGSAQAGRRALIAGISGQDGYYLAQNLLSKGYEVHGVIRRMSHRKYPGQGAGSAPSDPRVTLHRGDLDDLASMVRVIRLVEPDEIYNFGAHGAEAESFDEPEHTLQTDGLGVVHFLEGIRLVGRRETRYFQATSAAVFGKCADLPQTESASFQPQSPYAVAKACSHWMTQIYRRQHGLYACSGILFGHESPLRSRDGTLRNITYGLSRVVSGAEDVLRLESLDMRYDIGCARDYVEGAWRMLQQDSPGDYILATGEMRSVRELVGIVAEEMGLSLAWRVQDEAELGVVTNAVGAAAGLALGRVVVQAARPAARVDDAGLQGDAAKAHDRLDWSPSRTIFDLAREMAAADLHSALGERLSCQPS